MATIDKMAKRERLKNIGKSLAEAITGIGIIAVAGFLAAPVLEYVAQFNPLAAAIEGSILALPGLLGIVRAFEKGEERSKKLREKVEKAKERVLEALRERKIER